MLYSNNNFHNFIKYSLTSLGIVTLLIPLNISQPNHVSASHVSPNIERQADSMTNQIAGNILKTYKTNKANTKKHPYLKYSARQQAKYQGNVKPAFVKSIKHTASKKLSKHVNWYTAGLSKKELQARNKISFLESSNRWYISNGLCYGRYQLLPLYLSYTHGHVNLNKQHQVKVANAYVAKRYGSWQKALHFHLIHGYY